MAGQAAGPTKLQQLDRDALLRLLKKQSEQQKVLREQLSAAEKEKDEALHKLEAIQSTTASEPEENGVAKDEPTNIEELRADYENKLSAERISAAEAVNSWRALTMELADYDKQISNLKEEKSSLAGKLEQLLQDYEEVRKQLSTAQEELTTTNQFNKDLETTVQITKREVEELRMQKREAETAKMELLQNKMNEDSHSVKQVLDLTNELGEANRQTEMLKSSLGAVKAQRDSFAADIEVLAEKLSTAEDDYAKYMAKTKKMYDEKWKNLAPSSFDNLNQELAQVKQQLSSKDAEIEKLQNEAATKSADTTRSNERVERAERETAKWRSEAEANVASLTHAMDELRELRSRYEDALVEERDRAALAVASAHREHAVTVEKLTTERKMDMKKFENADFKLRSEIDALRRERDDLAKQLENERRPTPSPALMPARLETPAHQRNQPLYPPTVSSEPSLVNESPEPPLVESTLEDVIFGEERFENGYVSEDSTVIAVAIRERLKVADQQNNALRELLAESEGNNELFADQISVLKDEIRRIQRNTERENHVNNTEYLKNIMLQFVQPEKVNGARRQLVPILRTMLQLSEQEYHDLLSSTTEAASPEAASPSVSGISSFFHRWNGLS